MIDTIKVKIPITVEMFASVAPKCNRFGRKTRGEDGGEQLTYSKKLPFGSHGYEVNFSLYGQDVAFVEFSVPKYMKGHNITLIHAHDLPIVLDDLRNQLNDYFNVTFVEWEVWTIQRLDVCYGWRFPSQELARIAIARLKPYGLPSKGTVCYDTSITTTGVSSKVRFYLKQDEVKAHDYQKYHKLPKSFTTYTEEEKKLGIVHDGFRPFAEKILAFSEGVLRFEIELKKEKLDSLFKIALLIEDITDDMLLDILQKYLSEFLAGVNGKIQSSAEAYETLIGYFPDRRKALEIWEFYRLYTSLDPIDKEALKLMPRSTYLRKLKQLKESGIGISEQGMHSSFVFEIPSMYEVQDIVISLPETISSPTVAQVDVGQMPLSFPGLTNSRETYHP